MQKLKNYLGMLIIVLPSFIAAPLAAESLWTRSVDIRDGVPAPAAIQLAMAFKATAATHGIELTVALPIAGSPNRITWMASGSDVTSMQANFNKLQQSPEFQELFGKAVTMYENAHDEWWTTF
jgi:hypothetical protein|tara:strand:- start:238 stop:606 length:369 start_codon:yes stop_codon:yes gene_type:complete